MAHASWPHRQEPPDQSMGQGIGGGWRPFLAMRHESQTMNLRQLFNKSTNGLSDQDIVLTSFRRNLSLLLLETHEENTTSKYHLRVGLWKVLGWLFGQTLEWHYAVSASTLTFRRGSEQTNPNINWPAMGIHGESPIHWCPLILHGYPQTIHESPSGWTSTYF